MLAITDTIDGDGTIKSPEIVMTDKDMEESIMAEDTDYVLSGDTAADKAGTYFITIEGKGNYTGSLETSWELHNEMANYQKVEGEGGRGDLEIFVDIEGNTESVTVENLTIDVAKTLLTEEDLARYNAGEKVLIYVELFEEAKTAADVSEEELLLNEFKEFGATAIRWFDITVWKKIGNDAAQQMHEIETAIKITIEVPDEYQNAEEGYTRTFYLERAHEGTASMMAETTDLQISFSSDKFSTYAMAFKDIENKREEQDTEGDKDKSGEDDSEEAGAESDDPSKDSDKNENKSGANNQDTATGTIKTGDENNALVWIALFLMAAVAVIVSKLVRNNK